VATAPTTCPNSWTAIIASQHSGKKLPIKKTWWRRFISDSSLQTLADYQQNGDKTKNQLKDQGCCGLSLESKVTRPSLGLPVPQQVSDQRPRRKCGAPDGKDDEHSTERGHQGRISEKSDVEPDANACHFPKTVARKYRVYLGMRTQITLSTPNGKDDGHDELH